MKSARLLMAAATSLAIAGDASEAASLAERARASADWPEVEPIQRQMYEAMAALADGRHAEAEKALRAFAESPSVSFRYLGQSILGELQIGRGKDVEGAAWLEKARSMRWSGSVDGRPWLDPRGLLLLASAYDRLGDKAKARERVDELLKLWQRADPDLPHLAEARALKKKLAPRTAQATQR